MKLFCSLLMATLLSVSLYSQNHGRELMDGASAGDLARVEKALHDGADVNWDDWGGWTALHEAAKLGHSDVVRLLIQHGAIVNFQTDHSGTTPLHCAAIEGHLDIVRMLIENGADIHARADNSSFGHSKNSINYVEMTGMWNIVDDITPLHFAVYYGHEAVVNELLKHGANANAKTKFHRIAPLHWAADKGYVIIVKALLQRGADVNARTYVSKVETELLTVASNYNAKVNDGVTPLMVAKEKMTIETLIKAGAQTIR